MDKDCKSMQSNNSVTVSLDSKIDLVKHEIERTIERLSFLSNKLCKNGPNKLQSVDKSFLRASLYGHIEACLEDSKYYLLRGNLGDFNGVTARLCDIFSVLS